MTPEPSRSPLQRLVSSVLVGLLLAGCAGPTRVPPLGAADRGEQESFTPARDEARLWRKAGEEERKLRDSGKLYADPLLEGYLNDVAGRLTPAGLASVDGVRIRIHVLADPSLNAFAYPTGGIYVHTGLLARVGNEAQLATVLGHEITHVQERHLLEYTRSARRKAVGLTIAGIAGSIVLAGVAGKQAEKGDWVDAYLINQVGNIMLQLGLTLGFLAAVNGFGRDLEREADAGALALLDGARYDLREAPKVFELFLEDHGDPRKLETFFFGSHPNNRQRIANFQEMLAGPYAGSPGGERITDTPEFRARLRVLVRDNARLNMEAGRLGHAEADLRKVLAVTPNDAVAHHLLGEVHRLRAEGAKDPAADLAAALAAYEEAARLDPDYADPWRAIGLIRYREGDRASALGAFRRYLELAPPGAPERQRIRDYVVELEAAES